MEHSFIRDDSIMVLHTDNQAEKRKIFYSGLC